MIKITTLFVIMSFVRVFAQGTNYEFKAVDYFIENIESDTIFKQGCDCVHYNYDVNKTLLIYDSSYYSIKFKIALSAFHFEWTNSLFGDSIFFEKVQLINKVESVRIKQTANAKSFNENHYLIRFSNRLYYKNYTIIEFNIKSEKECSGINYFFLFNAAGEIENHAMTTWCDAQG